MIKKYSNRDVAIYALNYAVSKMHGNQETFKEYIKHTSVLRNIKSKYDNKKIYYFDELNDICTKYGNDSLLDYNLIFDEWFKIYLRFYKVNKIKNGYKEKNQKNKNT